MEITIKIKDASSIFMSQAWWGLQITDECFITEKIADQAM